MTSDVINDPIRRSDGNDRSDQAESLIPKLDFFSVQSSSEEIASDHYASLRHLEREREDRKLCPLSMKIGLMPSQLALANEDL